MKNTTWNCSGFAAVEFDKIESIEPGGSNPASGVIGFSSTSFNNYEPSQEEMDLARNAEITRTVIVNGQTEVGIKITSPLYGVHIEPVQLTRAD